MSTAALDETLKLTSHPRLELNGPAPDFEANTTFFIVKIYINSVIILKG